MGYYEDVYLKRLNRYGVDFQSRMQGQREENFKRQLMKSVYYVEFEYEGKMREGELTPMRQNETKTMQYLLTNVHLDMPNGTILFIEVKARAESHKSGTAQEAVGIAKQKRICRCADYYLHTKGIDPYRTSIRFDVVAITMRGETAASSEETAAMPEKASAKVKETKEENQSAQEEKKPEIRWLQNAFDYIPYGTGKPHWRVW